jgi:DNA-directed RNA polymerase II subunit RPB2
MDNQLIWNIIHSYFENNPQALVRHHIDSYNDFFKNGIFKIFHEKNPVEIFSVFDNTLNDFKYKCFLYFGGKNGKKIYFGKPVIHDKDNSHYMYPNEARLRNLTYAMTIHYDIDVEIINHLETGEEPVNMANIIHRDEPDIENPEEYEEYQPKEDPRIIKGGELEELLNGGGGPIKDKKAPQRRKPKQKQVNMTTTIAEAIRKKQEESMTNTNQQIIEFTLEKIYLGKFPIMVQSDFCILQGLTRELRFSMGECKNDLGGYFIIGGKEKTVITQEKFADNMLYIRDGNNVESDKYSYSAEIRSVSENVSKPIRTLAVKMVKPAASYTNNNIVVRIPNVRKPIPLFIVFRALGILSDKDIIQLCLLDLTKYEFMIDLFTPSIHDTGSIMTQQSAIMYIASFTKHHTVSYGLSILADFFLPHIGETNYIEKAYYLGYIVFRLLSVITGLEPPTDRDNFKFKRMELVGSLMNDLFREYYHLQQKNIHLGFESRLYYNQSEYSDNLSDLILQTYKEVLNERIVETGFRKAFRGNWGSQAHTKRIGVVQDLNRLSFNSMISHLRKTNIPLDSSVKLVGPRLLHNSQWGFIDPVDTPDGGNIGIHKHLSIMTYVSRQQSREPMIQWLKNHVEMKSIQDYSPIVLSTMTKIMINGYWAGCVTEPFDTVNKMKIYRRNALIPIYTSVTFEIKTNTIFIYTDAGRLCRPIFYKDVDTGEFSIINKTITDKIKKKEFTWNDLIMGWNTRKSNIAFHESGIYEIGELYSQSPSGGEEEKEMKRFLENKAIIDYIDSSETENTLILMNLDNVIENETTEITKWKNKHYTHLEIHESLMFGVMCNQIIFPENNPVTRNSFSCGQSKQACSLYSTNYQMRMDKSAIVLNHGQTPLVKSRYLEYINHEENPYGENAIVAIMCYTGYNVEDAILLNAGSLKRGLFRTTYFTVYEEHEENSKKGDVVIDKKFTHIDSDELIVGKKREYDYSQLEHNGLIKEGTWINDRTILIGMTSNNPDHPESRIDMSKTTKKGQLGVVDKSFITEGEEGERIAKVRIREERIPTIGDKMAGRAGQKGVVGLVIPEEDMPFTKDGIRPDMIINPHAFPSRQTIGQLVESVIGKASAIYGAFGDCTAFNNRGSKIGLYGKMLVKEKYHSSGNEILYNGMNGEQISAEIFIGPCYYMRLKHMVKDKINYRARGPKTALTRQPVGGRANDGGLRIGEMERDSLISHGAVSFLTESMMERGDKYKIAICNTTGIISIYNPSNHLFISPAADGPIKFNESIDGKIDSVQQITKFGRSFSIVSVPYSFKLLIHELQAMNIQMHIITEDTISQLNHLAYSKNMEIAMGRIGINMKDIIIDIKSELNKTKRVIKQVEQSEINEPWIVNARSPDTPTPPFNPQTPTYNPPEPSAFNPQTPTYNPPLASPDYPPESLTPQSLQYNPKTPPESLTPQSFQYNPTTPPDYESPPYAPNSPNSPAYVPNSSNSPAYASNSPSYVPNSSNSPAYQVGGKVYYRGDGNRPWTIKRVGGKFITIETDNTNGLGIQDSIQVVSPNEIYDISHPPIINPEQSHGSGYYGRVFGSDTPEPMTSGIHFAPKIIVNGSDNSNTPNSSQEPMNLSKPSIPNVPSPSEPESLSELDFSKPILIVKK